MKKFFKKIQHLVEYLLFLLMVRILRMLDIDKSAYLCSRIARLIGPFLPVTNIARKNLKNVFGESINQDKIIDELWDNFGRFIGEFPFVRTMSEDEIDKRIEIIGLEHTQKLKDNNQPFLLFTGHLANWDFALRGIYKLYHQFGIIYRKANNPYIDKIIRDFRSGHNLHLISKGPKGAKELIKSLKAGHAIAMLVDQKMNEGIDIPFFGRPAKTAHAIAKFALQFNYPILPCQIIRTHGSYFKAIIHHPLEIKVSGDNDVDCYNIMLKINHLLEEWIISNKSQWFWFHNRWG